MSCFHGILLRAIRFFLTRKEKLCSFYLNKIINDHLYTHIFYDGTSNESLAYVERFNLFNQYIVTDRLQKGT